MNAIYQRFRAQADADEAAKRAAQTQIDPRLQPMQQKITQTFANPQAGPRMQMEKPGQNPYLQGHFANQRNMLAQRSNAALQGQQDALRRRFAAGGLGNSGSEIKAMQLAQQGADQAREEAMGGIAGQEAQAAESAIARNFAREGQNFNQQLQESPIARLMMELQAQGALTGMDQGYLQLLNDKLANEANARLGQGQLDKSGGLFGGGGFMGLGL